MFGTVLRVLFGFALACLAGGLVQVLFVAAPPEWQQTLPGLPADRAADAGLLALKAATQAAIFSMPFALVAAAIGEWQSIRALPFYVLCAIAIALAGMSSQFASEIPGDPSIANPLALAAFASSGLVAGLVYWLVSGRRAGGSREPDRDGAPAKPPVVDFKQVRDTDAPPAKPTAKPQDTKPPASAKPDGEKAAAAPPAAAMPDADKPAPAKPPPAAVQPSDATSVPVTKPPRPKNG